MIKLSEWKAFECPRLSWGYGQVWRFCAWWSRRHRQQLRPQRHPRQLERSPRYSLCHRRARELRYHWGNHNTRCCIDRSRCMEHSCICCELLLLDWCMMSPCSVRIRGISLELLRSSVLLRSFFLTLSYYIINYLYNIIFCNEESKCH